MKRFLLFLSLFVSTLHAGSLTLINDTKYEMEVVIEGNDGSVFPVITIPGGQTERWDDNSFGHSRFLNKEGQENRNKNLTVTPYTVIWRLAKDQEFYSRCFAVRTGATVTANLCKQNTEK
ncbi:MAG: hypothetical protein HKM07_00075 [Chlamydiae bacterium]|jgi:hypothetical protein|nr:hypothetical protein [Chlamydiota bacterium]